VRTPLRYGLAVAIATLLLAAGCGGDQTATTTTQPFLPPSTPAAAPTTLTPASTAPAGPAVADAGGWHLAVTAPTVGATIGPTFNLCYELAGPGQGNLAFDLNLVFTATGTPATSDHVNATLGRGSALVDVGHPDPRQYNLIVQTSLNGQPIDKLTVTIGVLFSATAPPPAACP
jgi:hypothetical protein